MNVVTIAGPDLIPVILAAESPAKGGDGGQGDGVWVNPCP